MQLPHSYRRQHLFISAAITVIVVFWFFCCISLYWNSPVYQLKVGQLYESRWLLSSLAVNAFFTYLFLQSPCVVLFSALFVSTQYAIVYSAISLFVYTVDSINIYTYSPEGHRTEVIQYLRISITLVVLSILGFSLSIFHLRRLIYTAWESQQCTPLTAPVHRRFVQVCSALHSALSVFSIYVCSEMISLKTTYVQSYIVQQLCCALLALMLALIQRIFQNRTNRVIAAVIVVINACQFAQELAHAWNAYYVCIYIKSLAPHVGENIVFDQVMISITLLVHGVRLLLCALIIAQFSGQAFGKEVNRQVLFIHNPELLTSATEVARAAHNDAANSQSLFCLSAVISLLYVAVDIGYFCASSARRTLTASTGISLFYTLFIALSFHLYRRKHLMIALKVSAVFSIVLCNSAAHTIYVFVQDIWLGAMIIKVMAGATAAVLHGFELFLSICSLILGIATLRFSTRTVLLHTTLQTQPACIKNPLKMVDHLATINILTVALEFSLILIMKFGWKMGDPAVNFGVLDWISALSACVLQKWVVKYERYQSCLIILVLQLVAESLTTLPFLAAQTGYIQLMLSLARSANLDKLRQVLPIDHIIIILTDHALQVLQWAVALCSLGFSLILLEETVTEEIPPSLPPPSTLNGVTDSSRVAFQAGIDNVVFDDDSVQIVPLEQPLSTDATAS